MENSNENKSNISKGFLEKKLKKIKKQRTLTEKCFVYESGNIVEFDCINPITKSHFRYFYDSTGKELFREDFTDKGLLSEITVYSYSDDELIRQDFYSVKLKFYRYRDKKTGHMIDVDSKGRKIRTLREY
jgi:hypothetical protein